MDWILFILSWAFNIYSILIFIYILMSWIPQLQESSVGRVLAMIVEPYLSVFRRIIPPIGMIDLSPIVAILALRFIYLGLVYLIGLIGMVFV
ncbi:YggT family protein [Seinonella peptonophila]|nr:YggT family protein [Seinonella peptonophila]